VNERTILRDLISRERILIAPGVFDGLSAKLAERAGAEAVYLSGSGVSASLLAASDVGLVTMSEMVRKVREIARATSLPIIADADTGYGDVINVHRTVREYESAGASAIQIEDQKFPKRCGHFPGKVVIEDKLMLGRIRAAMEARRSDDFLVVARTDARADHGLNEAITRGIAYSEEGADVIFVEAPRSVEELREVAARIDAPLIANMVEGGRIPLLDAKRLEEIGYDIVIFPNTLLRTATKSMAGILHHLMKHGTSSGSLDKILGFEERNEILGLQQILEVEERFSQG